MSARFSIYVGFCINDAASSYWSELVPVMPISPTIQSL